MIETPTREQGALKREFQRRGFEQNAIFGSKRKDKGILEKARNTRPLVEISNARRK
jgi:hypothetical protein